MFGSSFETQSKWDQVKLFFGQLISAEGIKPDPNKVKAIKVWSILSNVKELQSFLGSLNYLSHFVPELSSLRTPLQPLVKTNNDLIWLKSHTEAFERIKNAISNDCLLQFYDVSCPLLIEFDAIKKGLGCILLQPTRQEYHWSRYFRLLWERDGGI